MARRAQVPRRALVISTWMNSVSPGMTGLRNLTPSALMKYPSLPVCSGWRSMSRLAACAIASTCSTPGITGCPGKCPWKNGSLIVTCLTAVIFVSPSRADDPVDHQERVAVRQQAHDLVDVERALAAGELAGGDERGELGVLLGERAGEFRVGRVARLDGDDVPLDAAPEQGEVADDVEHLVAHELVGEAHRLLAQHAVAAHDDGVFQAAALDEALFHERLDVLVKRERPRRGDFLFVGLGRDFQRAVLREPPAGADLRAGDAERVVGHDGQERAALGLDVQRFAHLENAGAARPARRGRTGGSARRKAARCRRRWAARWRSSR